MFKAIIVSSLMIVSFYSYSFAGSTAVNKTINEVATVLDCFNKKIRKGIYDESQEGISIDCQKWYDGIKNTTKTIDCREPLLPWFTTWKSVRDALKELKKPIPICFKKDGLTTGKNSDEENIVQKKIIELDQNILAESQKKFTLHNFSDDSNDSNEKLREVHRKMNQVIKAGKKIREKYDIENREYDPDKVWFLDELLKPVKKQVKVKQNAFRN